MIQKCAILFCDNEHGMGNVSFPDVKADAGYTVEQEILKGQTAAQVRKAAKAAGWGRVNGGDYCPACMESM